MFATVAQQMLTTLSQLGPNVEQDLRFSFPAVSGSGGCIRVAA